ncbi:MAG: iron-containing alcohol dehydrogenase [Pseudomonadales bacterium]
MNRFNENWNYPSDIRVGSGRMRELPEACNSLGMSSPLLVTDPLLAELRMVGDAIDACRGAGLRCGQFTDVQSNPTGANVENGVAVYRAGGHDGVIAFGGGSALDTGKSIALMAGQQRELWEFEDIGDNWMKANSEAIAQTIAIPTTAGTGSEVGRASVIIDEAQQLKRIIFHPRMLPKIVILDPELTVGLPAPITAATGMDALSHSLEAYCSPMYHPMADGIALEGIRLVKEYLPTAVADPQNIEARTQMLVASSMGATAFQKGLGGMHAISHSLGARYNAHHGLLNAILMPYVLKANQAAVDTRIARLSRCLDLGYLDFEGFLSWVLDFREQLDIPHTLAALDIDEQQAEKIGAMAERDPCAAGNPIAFTARGYSAIFSSAVKGVL